jgi:acetyl-CoA carboxylase carboxyltransferase component
MGPAQATSTLLDVMVASLKKQGQSVDAEELEKLRAQVSSDYERQTDVRYAAARLWVDAILDPVETRDVLIQSLEVATRHATDEAFRVGVYQV